MPKYTLEDISEPAAGFLGFAREGAIPWRRVAIDVVIVVLFVMTSSWFVRR